jgi:hypothetical protein
MFSRAVHPEIESLKALLVAEGFTRNQLYNRSCIAQGAKVIGELLEFSKTSTIPSVCSRCVAGLQGPHVLHGSSALSCSDGIFTLRQCSSCGN